MSVFVLAVLIIAIALVFDYINGFHDAANSIATIVATRVLTPFQAVLWAAFFNFIAAFLFGTAVAKTVGKGFVDLDLVTPYVIMAGLMGAIVWDLITWWLGLPQSGRAQRQRDRRMALHPEDDHRRPADRPDFRLHSDGAGLLAVPALHAVANGQVLPQAPVGFGGGIQPGARL
jgi:hypothetical protein